MDVAAFRPNRGKKSIRLTVSFPSAAPACSAFAELPQLKERGALAFCPEVNKPNQPLKPWDVLTVFDDVRRHQNRRPSSNERWALRKGFGMSGQGPGRRGFGRARRLEADLRRKFGFKPAGFVSGSPIHRYPPWRSIEIFDGRGQFAPERMA